MINHAPDPALLFKAETLAEALPYMQRYAGSTFVVKYGGHAMGDPALAHDFAQDVVLLQADARDDGGQPCAEVLDLSGVKASFGVAERVTL